MVSVVVSHHEKMKKKEEEKNEKMKKEKSVPSELKSRVNMEVALDSHSLSRSSRPSLISPTVSVDVQHHERRKPLCHIPEAVWTGRSVWTLTAYPIYFSPIPDKPYGFCGRKAPRKKEETQPSELRSCVKTGRWVWALTSCSIIPPVPDKPYGFCGSKAP